MSGADGPDGSPETAADPSLSPAQQDVLDALGARLAERPTFDPRLRLELRGELEDRLTPIADALPEGTTLFMSKRTLSGVHGCEAAWVADESEPFQWSAPIARGTVSHKAVELSVHWRGEVTPGGLVDEALARLTITDNALGDWLASVGEGERAELRGDATELVAKFLECFPPLEPRWRPVPESRLRAELCDDRIVLSGKVDLTVGAPSGLVAGKVLIDLKTGGFVPAHRDDLRFYALVETLRLGVPPRLLASYYLDSGRLHPEEVTEDLLRATLERVVRGVELVAELKRAERAPVLRPGPPCRWCTLLADCADGTRFLEERADHEGW